MLTYAVLVVAIAIPGKVKIDYEHYESMLECSSTSEFINDYNKDNADSFMVKSVCIHTNIVKAKNNGDKDEKTSRNEV